MKITKDMTIEEILKKHPESMKVFQQYNMGCIGCMGATAESVEKGALMHGVNVDEIVAALNNISASQ